MSKGMPYFFRGMYNNPDGYRIIRTFQKFLITENIWREYLFNLNNNRRPETPSTFIFDAFCWADAMAKTDIDWVQVHKHWLILCNKENL